MGIGPDSYGPPDGHYFEKIGSLGASWMDQSDKGVERDLRDKRLRTLADLAANTPDGGPPDMETVGKALMSIGDLTGAMSAAKLAQAQKDSQFTQWSTIAQHQATQRGLDIQDRTAATQERLAGVPQGYERTETGMKHVEGGPADPKVVSKLAEEKARDNLALGADKQDLETLGAHKKDAADAADMSRTIDEIRKLRQGATIGGYHYAGLPLAGMAAQAAASPLLGERANGNGASLDAAGMKFRTAVIKQMPGAITEKEQALITPVVPGTNMSDATANIMLDLGDATAARTQEKAQASATYFGKHKTLTGFDTQWKRYLDENQIVTQDKRGNVRLDRSNLGKWKGYVEKMPDGITPLNGKDKDEAPKGSKPAASKAAAPVGMPAPAGYAEGATVRQKSTGQEFTVSGGRLVPKPKAGAAPADAGED